MEAANPIKAYRQSEKLTQRELAGRLGVTRETLARWEAGRAPDRKVLSTITAATGIPAKVLRPDLAELMEAD